MDFRHSDVASSDERDLLHRELTRNDTDSLKEEKQTFSISVYVDDELAGSMVGRYYSTDFYIDRLAVKPEFRGQGLSRALIEQADMKAKEIGCNKVWIDTMTYEVPELYPKFGFVEQAVVKGYTGSFDRIFYSKEI